MNPSDDLVIKLKRPTKNGVLQKVIKSGKWWINRNTPVGENADIYECKPHGGNRLIDREEIIETIPHSD